MTIEELYDQIGNLDDLSKRIRRRDRQIYFVRKFLNNTSMDKLAQAMEDKDVTAAFEAIHDVKGTSLNLSFTRLGASSTLLSDTIKGKTSWDELPENIGQLYADTKRDYDEVVAAINELTDE